MSKKTNIKYKKYHPEYILGCKFEKNKIFYLIKWHGYDDFYNSWEPYNNIKHCTQLFENYNEFVSKKIAHIYSRVSNVGDTPLQVQKEKAIEYIKDTNMIMGKCIEEVYSDKSMNKLKGLCDIATKGQIILIYDISRLSQNIMDIIEILSVFDELNQKGVCVISIIENLDYSNIATRNIFLEKLCYGAYLSELYYKKVIGDYIENPLYGFAIVIEEEMYLRKLVCNEIDVKVIEK